MPDRVIRDEILSSERYWSVSAESRGLYLAILLCADDTARADGSLFALARRMAGTMTESQISASLKELSTADLVRPYQNGRYLFVPRFRQRMRYPNSKYPEPPKEIIELDDRKSDSSQSHASPKSYSSPSQVRPKSHEVKRSEEKKDKDLGYQEAPARDEPASGPKPIEEILSSTATVPPAQRTRDEQIAAARAMAGSSPGATRLAIMQAGPTATAPPTPPPPPPTNGDWRKSAKGIEQQAKALGIKAVTGETYGTLRKRCEEVMGRPRDDSS